MRENYYYGQGKVFLAPCDNKRSFRWVGDVSSLEVSFSYEQKTNKISRAGQLFQNKRFITAKWRLHRSRFGIRIDHDLACISDRGLASQSITIWHTSDH